LISAYLLENSGLVEIMRRVITEWVSDERLPYPTLETQYWLRSSEELFFTSPSPHFSSLTSTIRPDAAEIRENAYQRLFGLPLSFRASAASGSGTAMTRPRTTNSAFVKTFERLLFEVWRGYINRLNANNENRTDRQAVQELVIDLQDMFLARRTSGTLMREEFNAVAMLDWFYLTIEYDTHIVTNLNAQAPAAVDRISKIASLVGMQPSRNADSYFRLAEPMSLLFSWIESGAITAMGVERLYDGLIVPLTNMMQLIVSYWEKATGRAVKELSTVRPAQIAVPAGVNQTAIVNRLAAVSVPI
jgi:hypothetical protein